MMRACSAWLQGGLSTFMHACTFMHSNAHAAAHGCRERKRAELDDMVAHADALEAENDALRRALHARDAEIARLHARLASLYTQPPPPPPPQPPQQLPLAPTGSGSVPGGPGATAGGSLGRLASLPCHWCAGSSQPGRKISCERQAERTLLQR